MLRSVRACIKFLQKKIDQAKNRESLDAASEQYLIKRYKCYYQAKDVCKMLEVAEKLADIYVVHNDIKLISLSMEISTLCGQLFSTTQHLIAKAAIDMAMNIIEASELELPPREIIDALPYIFADLPYLYETPDFVKTTSERIARLYTVGTDVQIMLVREFLYNLMTAFSIIETMRPIGMFESAIFLSKQCRGILLNDKTPSFDSVLGYGRDLDIPTMSIDEIELPFVRKDILYEMLQLGCELKNFENKKTIETIGILKERYETLISRSISVLQTRKKLEQSECTDLCMIIEIISLWCNVDPAYAYEIITPYAKQLFSLEDYQLQSSGSNRIVASAYFKLGDIFGRVREDSNAYDSYISFMKFENLYFEKICFENDIESVFNELEFGNKLFQGVAYRCYLAASLFGYSMWDMYVELFKRKNFMYLSEARRRKYTNITDIGKLLSRDISINDICENISENTILIDFIYFCHEFNLGEYDGHILDKSELYLVAFAIHSNGSRHCKTINRTDFDDEIKSKLAMESILNELPYAEKIVICADGDLTSISFSALPYKKGFVIDYYPVRNIGSIYDLVFAKKRQELRSVLIFDAPDYDHDGKSNRDINIDDKKWSALPTSKLGTDVLRNALNSAEELELEYLAGALATAEELKNTLKSKAFGIVHFSTHGVVEGDNLGLVAAGANISCDSILWESDIGRLSLTGTSIMFYAICRGAWQSDMLVDCLGGFVKFSLLSDANTIIAPIADVDDAGCLALSLIFYETYLSDINQPTELALQKSINRLRTITKIELVREFGFTPKSESNMPFASHEYWANWVCYSKEKMR